MDIDYSSVATSENEDDDDDEEEEECHALTQARLTQKFAFTFSHLEQVQGNLSGVLDQLGSIENVKHVSFHRLPPFPLLQCLDIFKQYIRNNRQLESLQLTDVFLGNQAVGHILPALYRHTTLRSLDLEGNRLDHCGERLRDLIRRCKSLQVLDLCDNNLSQSTRYLAQGLQVNTTLTTLCLAGCRLEDAHLEPLCQAMTTGRSVVSTLDLRGNSLTAVSLNRLIQAVQARNILTSLSMGHNQNLFGVESSWRPWMDFLRNSPATTSLVRLDVHACHLPTEAVVQLFQALTLANSFLQGLQVDIVESTVWDSFLMALPQWTVLQSLAIQDYVQHSDENGTATAALTTAVQANRSLHCFRYFSTSQDLENATCRTLACATGRNVVDSLVQATAASTSSQALWPRALQQLDNSSDHERGTGLSLVYYALRSKLDLIASVGHPSRKRKQSSTSLRKRNN